MCTFVFQSTVNGLAGRSGHLALVNAEKGITSAYDPVATRNPRAPVECALEMTPNQLLAICQAVCI